MRLKLLVLLLALVASFVLSLLTTCDKEPEPNPHDSDTIVKHEHDFFPLAVGNYWIYEYPAKEPWFDTMQVMEKVINDSVQYYSVKSFIDSFSKALIRIDSLGFLIILYDRKEYTLFNVYDPDYICQWNSCIRECPFIHGFNFITEEGPLEEIPHFYGSESCLISNVLSKSMYWTPLDDYEESYIFIFQDKIGYIGDFEWCLIEYSIDSHTTKVQR
jgi:hypothetical protein